MKDKLCEVCGRPAIKEHSVIDEETTNSYYCSKECKRYNTWRAKIIIGIVGLVIGLLMLPTIAIIGLLIMVLSGVAIYVGYNDSKIVITTGSFAKD